MIYGSRFALYLTRDHEITRDSTSQKWERHRHKSQYIYIYINSTLRGTTLEYKGDIIIIITYVILPTAKGYP